jgi:flagellar capping protein FliD
MTHTMIELEKVKLLLNETLVWQSNRQENEAIKNKIKEFIISAHENTTLAEIEKQTVISKALELLSENTGCAEDLEIAQTIINDLQNERKIITQKDADIFYSNSPVNRWL